MQAIIWCWRRLIASHQSDLWIGRLQDAGHSSWVLTERPGRSRAVLEIYAESRVAILFLVRKFGGQARSIKTKEWLQPAVAKPIRLGHRFQITREKAREKRNAIALPQLYIPHGMAFGSGEHATTLMLLRAMARHENWSETTVLDLGTGSGILALAARLLGARRIVATDFDSEAVRTARQNEGLNFPVPLVRWQCADVKRRKTAGRYRLVVANLFSGILCDAASAIADGVLPGGQLWLSGILRSQQKEVIAAYRRHRMKFVRVVNRGKWVMIQFTKTGRTGTS